MDRIEEQTIHYFANTTTPLQGTVQSIFNAVSILDPPTARHQKRTAHLAYILGKRLELSTDQLQGLYLAALLHDVGKIGVPMEIINKPGTLNTREFERVLAHPTLGEEVVATVDMPWPVSIILRQHHERLDGSGYPEGLEGDSILPEAKILMVADVVEAMCSNRPYRPALPWNEVEENLLCGQGTLYESEIISTCLYVFERGYRFPG